MDRQRACSAYRRLFLTSARNNQFAGGAFRSSLARCGWCFVSYLQFSFGAGMVSAICRNGLFRLVVFGVFLLLGALASLAFRFPTVLAHTPACDSVVLALSAFVVAVSVAPLHGGGRVVGGLRFLLSPTRFGFSVYTLWDRNSRDRDWYYPYRRGFGGPFDYGCDLHEVSVCKGATYLRRIEARNSEELAVTQCKAMKLLLGPLF